MKQRKAASWGAFRNYIVQGRDGKKAAVLVKNRNGAEKKKLQPERVWPRDGRWVLKRENFVRPKVNQGTSLGWLSSASVGCSEVLIELLVKPGERTFLFESRLTSRGQTMSWGWSIFLRRHGAEEEGTLRRVDLERCFGPTHLQKECLVCLGVLHVWHWTPLLRGLRVAIRRDPLVVNVVVNKELEVRCQVHDACRLCTLSGTCCLQNINPHMQGKWKNRSTAWHDRKVFSKLRFGNQEYLTLNTTITLGKSRLSFNRGSSKDAADTFAWFAWQKPAVIDVQRTTICAVAPLTGSVHDPLRY